MTRDEELFIAKLFKSYFQEDIVALAETETQLTEEAKDIISELKADNPLVKEGKTWEALVTLYIQGAIRGFDLALKMNSITAAADAKNVYTIEEAAKIMRVSKQTMYNRIKAGKIKATKQGKSYLIQRADIEPFIIGE